MNNPTLALPGWVAENMAREQMSETIDNRIHGVVGFARLLKEYDPDLSLVLVKENADAPGLVPGCLHIKRSNRDGPDSYIPIATRDNKYRDPVSTDIDRLSQRDLWRVPLSEFLHQRRAGERQAERDKLLWREQARDEMAAEYKAAKRVVGEGGMDKRKWAKK